MLDDHALPYDGHFPLGCLAVPLSECEAFPVYGDGGLPDMPMIPRSKWPELIQDGEELAPDAAFGYTHDQNGFGMCTNSATTAAMEDTRIMQGGELFKLSAGDLYRRSGGGRDQGSTLTAALRFAMEEGVASCETVEYLDWRNAGGAEAAEDRTRHKILEAFWCPTFDHAVSALLSGFRTVCGIAWGNGFEPDSDGWIEYRGGGGGGHALKNYKPFRRGNRYGLGTDNSWKPTWGRNGRCILAEGHFRSNVFGGLFAVRVVTDLATVAVRGRKRKGIWTPPRPRLWMPRRK